MMMYVETFYGRHTAQHQLTSAFMIITLMSLIIFTSCRLVCVCVGGGGGGGRGERGAGEEGMGRGERVGRRCSVVAGYIDIVHD